MICKANPFQVLDSMTCRLQGSKAALEKHSNIKRNKGTGGRLSGRYRKTSEVWKTRKGKSIPTVCFKDPKAFP